LFFLRSNRTASNVTFRGGRKLTFSLHEFSSNKFNPFFWQPFLNINYSIDSSEYFLHFQYVFWRISVHNILRTSNGSLTNRLNRLHPTSVGVRDCTLYDPLLFVRNDFEVNANTTSNQSGSPSNTHYVRR